MGTVLGREQRPLARGLAISSGFHSATLVLIVALGGEAPIQPTPELVYDAGTTSLLATWAAPLEGDPLDELETLVAELRAATEPPVVDETHDPPFPEPEPLDKRAERTRPIPTPEVARRDPQPDPELKRVADSELADPQEGGVVDPRRQPSEPSPAEDVEVALASLPDLGVQVDRLPESVPTNPPTRYPSAQVPRGTHGWVIVLLTIDSDGRVADVRIEASSGHLPFEREAIANRRRWRFRPAQKDGQSVAFVVRQTVRFEPF